MDIPFTAITGVWEGYTPYYDHIGDNFSGSYCSICKWIIRYLVFIKTTNRMGVLEVQKVLDPIRPIAHRKYGAGGLPLKASAIARSG